MVVLPECLQGDVPFVAPDDVAQMPGSKSFASLGLRPGSL